jgi:two-component system, OmpR family, sensor histidine kinase KdpD
VAERRRGRLTIFTGYAAGVGKTYTMLEQAHERKAAGVDVVIGYFESHSRGETITKTEGLEIVPRKKIHYHGAVFEEMDTDAILERRPQVCIVDELPHSNVPGSDRVKRWQDVEVLLANGIDVWTTMNIQHLESLNDQIWRISGVRVHERVPDRVVEQADEIVFVDLTPQELLHRLRRGGVYEPREAERALQHFFREPTLEALRELAQRQAENAAIGASGYEESQDGA